MKRLTGLVAAALLVAGCENIPTDTPLATFTGGPGGEGTYYVDGTLELREGCLTVAVEEDGETFRAMLRLPTDGGSEAGWRGRALWFHQKSYDIGSRLVFGATTREVEGLPGSVPDLCRESGLEVAVSPVDGTTDLAVDPGAKVLGTGEQPRVVVAELSNAGMDALLTGDLTVVGDNCVGTRDSGGGTVLRWPFGTTVSYDPEVEVTLPEGTSYALGDRVELGGGFTSEPGSPSSDQVVSSTCGEDDLSVFLVSPS